MRFIHTKQLDNNTGIYKNRYSSVAYECTKKGFTYQNDAVQIWGESGISFRGNACALLEAASQIGVVDW